MVTKIKVINFFNYGYNKNQLLGEIFNKEFRLKLNENLKVFSFKILKTGVDIKINIAENSNSNLINGISKINILKNYFKIYFEYKNDNLKFINSKFKNKDLTISFDSLVKFNPFFEFNSNINVNEIDMNFITNIDLEQILKRIEYLKKFNSKNNINFTKKKSRNTFIKLDNLNLNFANGRLTFLGDAFITGGSINCSGDSLLTEEYPRAYFDCFVKIKDLNKFLKSFPNTKKFPKFQILFEF